MPDGLPTPCTTLRAHYVRVCLICRACLCQRDADLEALISAGRGDVPLHDLRFRGTNCRGNMTDFVVMSKAPWRRGKKTAARRGPGGG